MTLREQLLLAGVPESVYDDDALDVDRVERNITLAQTRRLKITIEAEKVVFQTITGRALRVEIATRRLWDPAFGKPMTGTELRSELAQLRSHGGDVTDDELARAGALGTTVGVGLEELTELLLVESIKGFGPQKFKEMFNANVTPHDVLADPRALPISGKRGEQFQAALGALTNDDLELARERAARQILRAEEHSAHIVTFAQPCYPRNVWESNNPIPILYVRGSVHVLSEIATIACVGSRKIHPPYERMHWDFASFAVDEGFTIASGFALGADTVGHRAAFASGGRTIAVMPSGLDRPFPPENRELWNQLLEYPNAVFVSEFPFGTAASTLTLRKRNKLIVAFARGVLISQSSVVGGAMNAYRFGLEQHKPVATFAGDGGPDTSGNNFIQEEATRQQPNLTFELDPVFPVRPDHERWKRWLHGLSYLI